MPFWILVNIIAIVAPTLHSTSDEIEEIQNALHANPSISDTEMRPEGTIAIYQQEEEEE